MDYTNRVKEIQKERVEKSRANNKSLGSSILKGAALGGLTGGVGGYTSAARVTTAPIADLNKNILYRRLDLDNASVRMKDYQDAILNNSMTMESGKEALSKFYDGKYDIASVPKEITGSDFVSVAVAPGNAENIKYQGIQYLYHQGEVEDAKRDIANYEEKIDNLYDSRKSGALAGTAAGLAGGAVIGLGAYAAKKLLQKRAAKKADMSEGDFSRPSKDNFELTDKMIKKFDKGHTWYNSQYAYFPHNKTRKFIYDVNKEIELQSALEKANNPALVERAAQLEANLRNPYKTYLPNAFIGSNGYHDRAKHIKERNAIIADAKNFSAYDNGKYTGFKKAYSQYDPNIYARSRVQDAKNSYRDLVQYAASLPEDERKKLFQKFEDNVSQKSTQTWWLHPYVDATSAQDYRNMTNN